MNSGRRTGIQLDLFPESIAPGMNFYARSLVGISVQCSDTLPTAAAAPAARQREDESEADGLGNTERILLPAPKKAGL